MKKYTSSILVGAAAVAGIVFGAFATSALAQWTAAPANPPANNALAPINVGYGAQTMQGGIVMNAYASSNNSAMTYGLWVVNAPIYAQGGLIIESRASDPVSPATGRMWLITP
jgi:hypothetical protein